MNIKKILLIFTLGAILVYASAVTGGKLFQRISPEAKEEYKTVSFPDNPLDTSGWNIYHNEVLGLEVRYPNGWRTREYASPDSVAFYHSRSEGADNGIYIEKVDGLDDVLRFDLASQEAVTVYGMHGRISVADKGLDGWERRSANVLDADEGVTYHLYFFSDPDNPGDFDYSDVFEQILMSLKRVR